MFEYETDYIKLHWQVQALKGQLVELERERDRTGNLLWLMRRLILEALHNLGVADDLGKCSDTELLARFQEEVQTNWRFSRCPDAIEYHCRPLALQTTRDGDPVFCADCGWDVRKNPLPPADLG